MHSKKELKKMAEQLYENNAPWGTVTGIVTAAYLDKAKLEYRVVRNRTGYLQNTFYVKLPLGNRPAAELVIVTSMFKLVTMALPEYGEMFASPSNMLASEYEIALPQTIVELQRRYSNGSDTRAS